MSIAPFGSIAIRLLVVTAIFLLLFPGLVPAQTSVGSIEGELTGSAARVATQVRVLLIGLRSGDVVQETRVDENRSFVLRDVPYARYRLQLRIDSVIVGDRNVTVSSGVPIRIRFDSLQHYSVTSVSITADMLLPDKERTGTHTLLTASTIRTLPMASPEKGIEAILLSTPGVVPDEDGRLHVRGEDAQLQYLIDGIPVTANLTRVYASLFNAALIKSVDLRTGGFDAEYGRATSAVLSINTTSGFDRPGFANAYGSIGSFGNRDIGFDGGGTIAGRVGLFGAFSLSQSDRYLDPLTLGDPIHDHADVQHFFGKADFVIGSDVDVDIIGAYNRTRFEVPNGEVRTPAQDQRQDLDDYLVGSRINIDIDDASILTMLGYRRHAHALLTSGGLRSIVTRDDSLRALAENEKFFIGSERTSDVTGGSLEYSRRFAWLDADHTVKFGAGGESYPLAEFFTFGVTNPALSNPDSAGGDIRYRRHDLTLGASPMLVDTSVDGTSLYFYVQDKIVTGRWTLNAGIRFDQYDLLRKESGISPRLNVAYAWNDELVLRGSYNRIIMQAPIENILVSSSSQARQLADVEQGTTPTDVRSETAHTMELGAAWRPDPHLAFDIVGYGKLIENFIVKVELGNSGIIFPVNLKEGLVAGGELRAELRDWHNLSGFLSVAGGVALGLKPSDSSSPIAAGLVLGEEGRNYSHPFAGEDAFPTEHNQLLTAAMNIAYNAPAGWFASFGARFDMGLPFDLTGSNGEGLTPEQSRTELKRRGYSDEVIDLLDLSQEKPGSPDKSVAPHIIFDVGAGIDLDQYIGTHVHIDLDLLNVLDTRFLYKFESSFGGTHVGYPRTITLKASIGI
jgi:outer membrane receptor protein involved in Fe transport